MKRPELYTAGGAVGVEAVKRAIAEVERTGWAEDDARWAWDGRPESVEGAERLWRKTGFGEIYGSGGIARYLIRRDGEVVYSSSHGTRLPKALAAGFRDDAKTGSRDPAGRIRALRTGATGPRTYHPSLVKSPAPSRSSMSTQSAPRGGALASVGAVLAAVTPTGVVLILVLAGIIVYANRDAIASWWHGIRTKTP